MTGKIKKTHERPRVRRRMYALATTADSVPRDELSSIGIVTTEMQKYPLVAQSALFSTGLASPLMVWDALLSSRTWFQPSRMAVQ